VIGIVAAMGELVRAGNRERLVPSGASSFNAGWGVWEGKTSGSLRRMVRRKGGIIEVRGSGEEREVLSG
jgi:hypothetical protein